MEVSELGTCSTEAHTSNLSKILKSKMTESIEKCPHCGATMKKFWHRLSPGLVRTLVKIYSAISEKGENNINPHHEMSLSTVEHMNMTKLRFHGLIAKYRKDKQIVRGVWVMTARGADFFKGKLSVPLRVQTLRNHVVGYSDNLVTVSDVMRTEPFWESNFERDIFEPKQQSLI